MDLLLYAQAILRNVESRGFQRYDSSDVDTYIAMQQNTSVNNLTRKTLRAMDIAFPILLRKLLSIKKEVSITTYYHIGMALLSCEKANVPIKTAMNATDMGLYALDGFYSAERGLWMHPYPNILKHGKAQDQTNKTVSMPMHGLARTNILLLALWKEYKVERFLSVAVKSLQTAMKQHNIREYEDGTAFISYYYNSTENVLNVNSEFLQWIVDIPQEYRPQEAVMLGHKILKMLLREQNQDGSFYYVSKENIECDHIKATIDNHHTSYVLGNLVHILDSDFPTKEERHALQDACERGMEFSLTHLFHEKTGEALYMINCRRRKPDPVTYSEAIVTFCAFLRSANVSGGLKERLKTILPKVIRHLLLLINLRDGSAPSENVFGKWSRLDSIRWGNGPALQAIFDYYAIEQEGL